MTVLRLCAFLVGLTLVAPAIAQEPRLDDEIRQEATRPNRGDTGRPLPLAAHWNTSGADKKGFSPAYQLQLLKEGHTILPWLDWPPTDYDLDRNFKKEDARQKYVEARVKEFEPVIKELARQRLPLALLATQWESHLTYDKAF